MEPDRTSRVAEEGCAAIVEKASADYEEAMRTGRGQDAERIALAALAGGLSVADLYERVVAPAMARIGALWASGLMTIADEHLASALNFKVMASVYSVSLADRPAADRGRVMLAGVEGDRHGVGLRMAGDVLELAGFEVIYLGEDVSTEDLVLAVAARGPDVIALAVPTPAARAAAEATIAALRRRFPKVPLVVGGQGAAGGLAGADEMLRSSTLAELPIQLGGLVPVGALESRPRRSDPAEMALPAIRSERETRPEDRLLEIAAESAESARAHARIANAYRRLADEDPLTGAPNRRAFDEKIAQLRDEGAEAMLLMTDLDGFKQVNDRFGHAAGDGVLQRVARRIERELQPGDFMARLGGDEFAVLLPRSSPAAAQALAQAIVAGIGEELAEEGVTAAAGIAPLSRDRRQGLIGADLALYRAKGAGGNRVEGP
jgi:diguanylate cyclase (GGDEF)-like protein